MDSALLTNQRPLSPLLKETTQSSIPSKLETPLISMTEDQMTSYTYLSLISEEPSQKLLTTTRSDINLPANTSNEPNTQFLFSGLSLLQSKIS